MSIRLKIGIKQIYNKKQPYAVYISYYQLNIAKEFIKNIIKKFFCFYFAEKETILFIDSHIWFIYNRIEPYTVDIKKIVF